VKNCVKKKSLKFAIQWTYENKIVRMIPEVENMTRKLQGNYLKKYVKFPLDDSKIFTGKLLKISRKY
jgi:hypothetical protein